MTAFANTGYAGQRRAEVVEAHAAEAKRLMAEAERVADDPRAFADALSLASREADFAYYESPKRS